jgi:hypothetical protein
MEGRSKLSIDSALKVSKYVRVEQIKQIPFLEFFHTIPLLSYVRFAKWDEILSYEKAHRRSLNFLWVYIIMLDRLLLHQRVMLKKQNLSKKNITP